MKLAELLKTKEYKDAVSRIGALKGRLEGSSPQQAFGIRCEKEVFFNQMREARPDLYVLFKTDDKTLGEMIYKRITGNEITLD